MPVHIGKRQARREKQTWQPLPAVPTQPAYADVDEPFVAAGVRPFVAYLAVAVPVRVFVTGSVPLPRLAGRGRIMIGGTDRTGRTCQGTCSTGAYGEQDKGDAN